MVCQGGERPLFTSVKRRKAFTDILRTCADIYRVKILAFALLRKRVYFVIVPPSAEALSSFMRVTQTRFARFLHANGFKGEVTPRRFASCPLDNPTAVEAIKFVETRPVAEGPADEPTDYPYSSASQRNGHAVESEIDAADLLSDFRPVTGRIDDWETFHETPLDPERAEWLAMRMRTGKPAGRIAFIRRVEKEVGMNLSRGRGRPKGS
ncbi:MAG: hypothetical protein ACOC95_08075 [Planctomycetota bacterium]